MKHIKLLNTKRESLPSGACWLADTCSRRNYAFCIAMYDVCGYDYGFLFGGRTIGLCQSSKMDYCTVDYR